MNCAILSSIYLRSNGDITCHDDAGSNLLLGRVFRTDDLTDVDSILSNPFYTHIRESLNSGGMPWSNVCSKCAFLRPNEPTLDALRQKRIKTLQVEPTLACSLACPGCNRKVDLGKREKPFVMSVEVFSTCLRSFHDSGYQIDEIEYCGGGEPLNNPKFREFVETARKIYPQTRQRLITNGNFDYEKTVGNAFLDEIIVSRDGVYQESYAKYRINGHVDKVDKFLLDIPSSVDGRWPRKTWKYILFEFNDGDDEIIEAQRRADELECDELRFVFTHSVHKSVRFHQQNYFDLPIVSIVAMTVLAPVSENGVKDIIFEPKENAPQWSGDQRVLFMIDKFCISNETELALIGWCLALGGIDRIMIHHNGKCVGQANIAGLRRDVYRALPMFKEKNSGYSLTWSIDTLLESEHEIEAEIVTVAGEHYTFSRRSSALA